MITQDPLINRVIFDKKEEKTNLARNQFERIQFRFWTPTIPSQVSKPHIHGILLHPSGDQQNLI